MKIRKLQLKNIGVFDDETIEFQPCLAKDKAEIHILTGENGSGKSTILMALASGFDTFDKHRELDITPRGLSNNLHKRFRFDSEITKFEINTDLEFVKLKVLGDKYYKLATCEALSLQTTDYEWWANSIYGLSDNNRKKLNFRVFAFSGYRQIQSERIEAIKEPKEFNPLSQSLEFVKDYNQSNELTINQLIGNNISKSAIEKGRNENKSIKFASVIKSIEKAISEITGWKVEFDLETEPTNLITKVNGYELDFDVLPDGLRSLISWIADLLGRVDLLKWQDDLPIFEKNLILLLDEIEVHLHPAWQRKVLPVVQKLFKNAQIFVSTHSPFVVNSVDDAWIYKLKLENGKAKVESVERSEDARSYRYVLRNTFDIENEFGVEIEKRLEDFYKERDSLLAGNGNSKKAKAELKKIAKELSKQSKELKSKIDFELFQLSEVTGEDFDL